MSGKGLFYVLTGRRLIGTFENIKLKKRELEKVKKKKVTFEELMKANRLELMEDQKQLEKIEERLEAKRLDKVKQA